MNMHGKWTYDDVEYNAKGCCDLRGLYMVVFVAASICLLHGGSRWWPQLVHGAVASWACVEACGFVCCVWLGRYGGWESAEVCMSS